MRRLKIPKPNRATKVCSMCKEEKPIEEYTWYRRKKKNGEFATYACPKCKKCGAAHRRQKYHSSVEVRERVKQANKRWGEKNREARQAIYRRAYHARQARLQRKND